MLKTSLVIVVRPFGRRLILRTHASWLSRRGRRQRHQEAFVHDDPVPQFVATCRAGTCAGIGIFRPYVSAEQSLLDNGLLRGEFPFGARLVANSIYFNHLSQSEGQGDQIGQLVPCGADERPSALLNDCFAKQPFPWLWVDGVLLGLSLVCRHLPTIVEQKRSNKSTDGRRRIRTSTYLGLERPSYLADRPGIFGKK